MECPECFGKYATVSGCGGCFFHESCKFYTEEERKGSASGGVSYEAYGYSSELATPPNQDEEVTPSEDSELLQIMEFLLDIDNYTAELLSEVLHGNVNTSADLAERFGVSRQAIHRKLVASCAKHPHLKQLFITRLYRCKRILKDKNNKQEIVQMELDFNS